MSFFKPLCCLLRTVFENLPYRITSCWVTHHLMLWSLELLFLEWKQVRWMEWTQWQVLVSHVQQFRLEREDASRICASTIKGWSSQKVARNVRSNFTPKRMTGLFLHFSGVCAYFFIKVMPQCVCVVGGGISLKKEKCIFKTVVKVVKFTKFLQEHNTNTIRMLSDNTG